MLPVFAHASVRDMAWIAFSPPLLNDRLLPMRDPLQGSAWRDDPEQLLHALQTLVRSTRCSANHRTVVWAIITNASGMPCSALLPTPASWPTIWPCVTARTPMANWT